MTTAATRVHRWYLKVDRAGEMGVLKVRPNQVASIDAREVTRTRLVWYTVRRIANCQADEKGAVQPRTPSFGACLWYFKCGIPFFSPLEGVGTLRSRTGGYSGMIFLFESSHCRFQEPVWSTGRPSFRPELD